MRRFGADRTEKCFIVLIVLLVVVIPLLLHSCDFGLDVGTGKQAGYIAEIEESGIFWRPPELRLLNIIPTMSEGDTSWHYGIDPKLKETALEYSRTNTPVTVHYRVERFVWNWEYANRVIIYNIEPNELK